MKFLLKLFHNLIFILFLIINNREGISDRWHFNYEKYFVKKNIKKMFCEGLLPENIFNSIFPSFEKLLICYQKIKITHFQGFLEKDAALFYKLKAGNDEILKESI